MNRFLKCWRGLVAVPFILSFFLTWAAVTQEGWAQTAPTGQATSAGSISEKPEDSLRRENIRKFEAWRATIPDYEKRLYDRVKGINRRVLNNTRLNVVVLIVLIGFAAFIIYMARNGYFGRQQGDRGVSPRIHHRQRRLGKALRRIEENLVDLNREISSLDENKKKLTELVARCRSYFDDIGSDIMETEKKDQTSTKKK